MDFNRNSDGVAILRPWEIPPDQLKEGTKIVIYEPEDIECDAILRRGVQSEWVADIVKGTIRELPIARTIDLLLSDGARIPVKIIGEEIQTGTEISFRLTLHATDGPVQGISSLSFFRALRELRLKLEERGMLLCCFGASEDVYPSAMSEQMGRGLQAYRTRLGHQALRKDLVDIFDSDYSVRPTPVYQQEQFHEHWINSLGH